MIYMELVYPETLNHIFKMSVTHLFEDPLHRPYWTAILDGPTFAPGIWAGMYGAILTSGDLRFQIVAIDMHEKQLRLKVEDIIFEMEEV